MKHQGPWKIAKEPNSPKYLIVCDGGNVRSAAIATTLKLDHGREAIAIGRLYMSSETMEMLSGWADVIVLTQSHMIESVPEKYHNKALTAEVGVDRWGISIPHELNSIADQAAAWLVEKE